MTTQHLAPADQLLLRPDPARVVRALDRRSFCTLATTSAAGRPHVAGVLYERVDGDLWVGTLRPSRKVRNVVANPQVAVCVPVRRLPLGPPASIQFQATAQVLAPDDPAVSDRLARRQLRTITSHGELDLPGACVLRIRPTGRLTTFGLGLPLHRLLRDPVHSGGVVELAG